jgi:hypothetical protein
MSDLADDSVGAVGFTSMSAISETTFPGGHSHIGVLTAPVLDAHRVGITFQPFDTVKEAWLGLTRFSPRATLYHSAEWVETLRRTYGFRFRVAMLEHRGVAQAGIIFARVHRPLSQWWVALPFSDTCPPLALDPEAEAELLTDLHRVCGNRRFEIRGMTAPERWQNAECFLSWELDISEPPSKLYARLESNFRRNLAKARKAGVAVEHGNSPELIERFYQLHARSRRRLGLPCQSSRFFRIVSQVFRNNIDVWLASHGGRDVGAVFLIAHGDALFYKWSARDGNESSGAVHLLAWSLVEHWAGKYRRLDLGRTDARNVGLNRFKSGIGGRSNQLPYAFFPGARTNPSSEILSGRHRLLADIWRRLPAPVCRAIERFAYQYLS